MRAPQMNWSDGNFKLGAYVGNRLTVRRGQRYEAQSVSAAIDHCKG